MHYEEELLDVVLIAEKFQKEKEKIPYYLDLLAVTPVRQWGKLFELYFGKPISEKEKVKQVLEIMIERSGQKEVIVG
jgi:hypothetical protein